MSPIRDELSELLTFTMYSGALPRQLILEHLDSIQKILFPLSDPKSRALLLSLTTREAFDPECLRFESAPIRHAGMHFSTATHIQL